MQGAAVGARLPVGDPMKPDEARRQRKAIEAARAARGERLEHFLRTGEPRDVVKPDLIPGEDDFREAVRDVRRLVRRANVSAKGRQRSKILDRLIVAAGRLVYVERVMALDELERAALTPARLMVLSTLSPEDVRVRMAVWQGEGGVVLPGEETT